MRAKPKSKAFLTGLVVVGVGAWLLLREPAPEMFAESTLEAFNRGDYVFAYEAMSPQELAASGWTPEKWQQFCKAYVGDPKPTVTATFREADPGKDEGKFRAMWNVETTRQYYFSIPGLSRVDKQVLQFGVRRNRKGEWTPDVVKVALLYGKQWTDEERFKRLERAMQTSEMERLVVFTEGRQIKLSDLVALNGKQLPITELNKPYP